MQLSWYIWAMFIFTQLPLLLYALYKARIDADEKIRLIRLASPSLGLPSSVTDNPPEKAAAEQRAPKTVQKLTIPVPMGAIPRRQIVVPPGALQKQ